MTAETTRVCIVRHGETDWNVVQRMQGHYDLELNATGKTQARAVGQYFSGCQAQALYSSDLLRARHTAQPIAQVLDLPVQVLPALRERNFGRFEGMTLEEIAAENPGSERALECRDPEYAPPGGGESLRQLGLRVVTCLDRLVSIHRGETIVLVTHGGVLDIINRRARGLTLAVPRDFEVPNTGINWVSITGGQWQIECWGETKHLLKQEVKLSS